MAKIIAYQVLDEELPSIKAWSEKNNVEVKVVKDDLNKESVQLAKGFDGVTVSANEMLDNDIYDILSTYGIQQIAQRSAGFDYYELDVASAKGIIISNVPVYSPESIAEFTLTQALMFVRKIDVIEEKTAEQDFRWQEDIQAGLLGEKTIGIIGTGHIGRATAKLFHGFGAKVLGFDIYPNEEAEAYLEYKESVEEIIQEADIVTLHVPATDDNYHQFNYELFKQFKATALLINNARGSVVDTEDLIKALDEGLLFHAALDTYENEGEYIPLDMRGTEIKDELFQQVLNHPKISFTPHIAYYTDVSVRNIVISSLDATLEVIQTGDTKNRVN